VPLLENRLRTATPMIIRPIPTIAHTSSFCPWNIQAIVATSTIPTPAQIAYATPTGIDFRARERK
jgi:hypothetical protein